MWVTSGKVDIHNSSSADWLNSRCLHKVLKEVTLLLTVPLTSKGVWGALKLCKLKGLTYLRGI